MPKNIKTPAPAKLLTAIKAKIDSGTDIKLWTYQGNDFEYKAAQYADEGILQATLSSDQLQFTVKWKETAKQKTRAMIAIYLSRFSEEVLSHFGKADFSAVSLPPIS
jgi:hypothetical protein